MDTALGQMCGEDAHPGTPGTQCSRAGRLRGLHHISVTGFPAVGEEMADDSSTQSQAWAPMHSWDLDLSARAAILRLKFHCPPIAHYFPVTHFLPCHFWNSFSSVPPLGGCSPGSRGGWVQVTEPHAWPALNGTHRPHSWPCLQLPVTPSPESPSPGQTFLSSTSIKGGGCSQGGWELLHLG